MSEQAIAALPDRLGRFWERFGPGFKTKTHDPSAYAWVYLKGLLLLETNRNLTHIARRVIAPQDDGQNVQHFMSASPWVGQTVIQQVQREIAATPCGGGERVGWSGEGA